jgi:chaperonin GroEL
MDGIVKNLSFGDEAKNKVFKGIEQLTKAVSSTLGASGKCVIMEDNNGNPIITKDGVTVANSVILRDPVENMGATLLKEAARKTVREAGDGTTTATVLAHSIMKHAYEDASSKDSFREMKDGISSGVEKVIDYLKSISIPVKGNMIDDIATISTNNDKQLGTLIADAFRAVGEKGVEYHKGFCHGEFITDKEKNISELDNALVLLMDSKVDSIRQVQPVLEHVIKKNKALLIIGDIEAGVLSALVMNKKKGNIKINVVEPPAFGLRRKEIFGDLSLLTGATVINEDLGDDLSAIQVDYLGSCVKSTSTQDQTIIQIHEASDEVEDIIATIKEDLKKKNKPHIQVGLELRLARLSAKVAVVKIGANSDIELKEKSDRVEDAICATKAAIKEGIVPGGGIALLNASNILQPISIGEKILLKAIRAPFFTLLANAGIVLTSEKTDYLKKSKGEGLDVVTGKMVNMVELGIIDPLLVTKSALINAASVASTILSTDCVINNMRIDESNR